MQFSKSVYVNGYEIKNDTINNIPFFEEQISGFIPEQHVQFFNQYIKPLGHEMVVSWMTHQVYLAVGVLLSSAAAMDIDATPMEGIQPEPYAKILGLTNYTPVVAVALGYRDESDKNQPSNTPKKRFNFDYIIKSI